MTADRPAGRPQVVLLPVRPEDRDANLALLTAEERIEAARYLRQADRDRFAAGRAQLRRMLGGLLAVEPGAVPIRRDQNGKPQLAEDQALAFNVSHSGGFVAVAAGPARAIGIDVEEHRSEVDMIAVGRLIFSAAELARVEAVSGAARMLAFYRHWVIKEALVKALGTGLLLEPRRFEVRFGQGGPSVAFVGPGPDDIGDGWLIEEIACPAGYSAALAWRPEAALIASPFARHEGDHG